MSPNYSLLANWILSTARAYPSTRITARNTSVVEGDIERLLGPQPGAGGPCGFPS